jgi:hypothetical protein
MVISVEYHSDNVLPNKYKIRIHCTNVTVLKMPLQPVIKGYAVHQPSMLSESKETQGKMLIVNNDSKFY